MAARLEYLAYISIRLQNRLKTECWALMGPFTKISRHIKYIDAQVHHWEYSLSWAYETANWNWPNILSPQSAMKTDENGSCLGIVLHFSSPLNKYWPLVHSHCSIASTLNLKIQSIWTRNVWHPYAEKCRRTNDRKYMLLSASIVALL